MAPPHLLRLKAVVRAGRKAQHLNLFTLLSVTFVREPTRQQSCSLNALRAFKAAELRSKQQSCVQSASRVISFANSCSTLCVTALLQSMTFGSRGVKDPYICTCTQQLPPPSREATGVFRAATGVAAAPRRGANPPFATEELGVGLPMYVYDTYGFCLNMSKITFA